MIDYRSTFLELCVENEILMFGEFILKSGRVSPYFFNAGKFDNGHLLAQLANSYTMLITERIITEKLESDIMLYGPAYKGIPLAAATAVQMSEKQGIQLSYAYNRKETKDHGEGGNMVGAPLTGNVVIIDDVITAGTSVNDSVEIIRSADANPYAIVIALDRQEVADGDRLSAVKKIEQQHGIPVYSLIKLQDLVEYVHLSTEYKPYYDAINTYRSQFGFE